MKPDDISRRLRGAGRSQAALGRHLGVSKDSISRLLKGDRKMSADELARIQAFFAEGEPQAATRVIEVFGYVAAGGDDRIAIASDQVLDHVEIPTGLVRGDAIALRVAGDSMYPRFMSGELAIVEIGVSPMRDRDCVVEFHDGTGLVKTYKGARDGRVWLHQYNPDNDFSIEGAKVKAVHSAFRWR